MKNEDGGFRLPEEIDPQRVQFCIEIPNDLNHIIAFWGALRELTKWWNWQRDEEHTALIVTHVWEDVIEKARASFEAGECASPELCQDYRPTSARLTWFPENPYTPDAEVPDGYTYHPWTIVDNSILGTIIGMWGLGYQVGDVYTDFTKLPAMSSWIDIFENLGNMPSFTLDNLHGEGTVKLHFLNIPQGGRVLIQIDDSFDLLNLQLVELNKDIVSVPQETQVPFIVEVKVEGDGDHSVKCSFLPTVDDTFIPIFFGGGFRGFELCGFGVVPMPTEACCDETNDLLRKIVNLMEGGVTADIKFSNSSNAGDLKLDCSTDNFDGNDDDEVDEAIQRKSALCITVARYIVASLYNLAVDQNNDTATRNALKSIILPLALPNEFTSGLVRAGAPNALNIEGLEALATAYSTVIEDAICEMTNYLTGKQTTYSTFKLAIVDASGEPTDVESTLRKGLHIFLFNAAQLRQNFVVFANQLQSTFAEVVDGLTYECPCEPVPIGDCADFIPVDYLGTGTTFEYMGDCHWKINSGSGTPYNTSIADAFGRCFKMAVPTLESGLSLPGCSDMTSTGCCGDEDYTGGCNFSTGAAGGKTTGAAWQSGTPNYYRIVPVTPEECI